MSEHPQVTRTRAYFDAFANGDAGAMRDFFSDDIVWHVAGDHPLSGDYAGKDALLDYFAKTSEQAELTLEPTGIIGNDRHVAIFLRVAGRRGEKTMQVEMCEMVRLGPDGRWTEFWAMPDDQGAVDAFWSDGIEAQG
jgi:ketosteroid isomerase-like protein